ncbi:anthocyanidin 3-O-glucosyltransferase 2-like [Pyrus ussuriensis x Pyrus communis]|uniref:Anthocyanidin 3-O-glucosyltransferase 2-like n=1 Tax=Pyrus ussuriensis x Pyrus communis TaxID=2448454 RepID=A0A5N5FNU5_9ROSA|nr:anthocyanidin 3-O-glucosyltransferase 2-like [Pyrus ussuriensis x Pyrus communis]
MPCNLFVHIYTDLIRHELFPNYASLDSDNQIANGDGNDDDPLQKDNILEIVPRLSTMHIADLSEKVVPLLHQMTTRLEFLSRDKSHAPE